MKLIEEKKFPDKLKLANLTPDFKYLSVPMFFCGFRKDLVRNLHYCLSLKAGKKTLDKHGKTCTKFNHDIVFLLSNTNIPYEMPQGSVLSPLIFTTF